MKKIGLLFYLSFILRICTQSWVSPLWNGGRFGDNLTSIWTALCFAYNNDFEFFCQTFEYSDKLKIHNIIPKSNSLNNIVYIRTEADLSKFKKTDNTVYKIGYKTKSYLCNENVKTKVLQKFKKIIAPKEDFKIPSNLPKNCNIVAVHVRKGGGFDPLLLSRSLEYADQKWPTKFPPDLYYIEQIKKMFELLDKQKMHVHLFTDYAKPQKIVEKYSKALNEPLISFSYRAHNSNYKDTTVEDFFVMSKFQYLIRPASSFSENVQRIGQFKIVIFPEHAIWTEKDKLIIDKVKIIINKLR